MSELLILSTADFNSQIFLRHFEDPRNNVFVDVLLRFTETGGQSQSLS